MTRVATALVVVDVAVLAAASGAVLYVFRAVNAYTGGAVSLADFIAFYPAVFWGYLALVAGGVGALVLLAALRTLARERELRLPERKRRSAHAALAVSCGATALAAAGLALGVVFQDLLLAVAGFLVLASGLVGTVVVVVRAR